MENAFPGDAKSKLPRVVVLGAGYVGRAVVEAALGLGHPVIALTRNPEKARGLEALGAETVVADLSGDAWHTRVSAAGAWVLLCVSSGGGGPEAYQQSYYDGAKSVSSWLAKGGPASSLVYTSSTSVYPQGDGATVTEELDAEPASETGKVLRRTERVVLEESQVGSAVVLRLAGIYGPGRHHLLDQLRVGVAELPGRGDHRLNLIHRDDIVSAVLAVWCRQQPDSRAVYNLADRHPAPKEQMVKWLCDRLARGVPHFNGLATGGRRSVVPDRIIDAGKIGRELGWVPRFPSFKEGYSALLGA